MFYIFSGVVSQESYTNQRRRIKQPDTLKSVKMILKKSLQPGTPGKKADMSKPSVSTAFLERIRTDIPVLRPFEYTMTGWGMSDVDRRHLLMCTLVESQSDINSCLKFSNIPSMFKPKQLQELVV